MLSRQSNESDRLDSILTAQRARYMLDLIDEHTQNGDVLVELLAEVGLTVSRQGFERLVDRMARDGLVRTHIAEIPSHRVRVVYLTAEGREVQQGRIRRDWIAPTRLDD